MATGFHFLDGFEALEPFHHFCVFGVGLDRGCLLAFLLPVGPHLLLEPFHKAHQIGTLLTEKPLLRKVHGNVEKLGQVSKDDTIQGTGRITEKEFLFVAVVVVRCRCLLPSSLERAARSSLQKAHSSSSECRVRPRLRMRSMVLGGCRC